MGQLGNPSKVQIVKATVDRIDREIKRSQERLLKKIEMHLSEMSGQVISDRDADGR